MDDTSTKDDSASRAMLPAIPNPSSGAMSLQSGDTATDRAEPTHPTSTTEVKSTEPQHARHDSVISDGAVPAASPKAAADQAPVTRKPLNLGSSILKTPSVAAGSESSATRSQKSPSLGSSVLKTPSPAASSKPSWPQFGHTAGSTWVTKYEGEPWPAVTCDETTAPRKFMETRHDASHLPAILLGKRIYVWVIPEDLKPFIRDNDYLHGCKKFDTDNVMPTDSKADATEKLRQRAFMTDALLGADQSFWNNAIENERAARKQKEKMGPTKRRHVESGDSERSFSSRKRPRDRDSAEMLRSGYKYPRRSKKRVFELESSDDEDSGFDDGLFVANKTSKKDQRRTFEREEEGEIDKLQENFQANHRQDFMGRKGTCTIYVSAAPSKTSFRIPNSALGHCGLLTGMLRHADPNPTPTEDTYINLYETLKVEPEDFKIVATFLIKKSFTPHVVKGRHGEPVLEGVRTAKDVDGAAEHLARAYYTASRLRFGALQLHCAGKLRYLDIVSPGALVMAMAYFINAQGYGCVAEAHMEEWLVDRVSRSFLDIVEQEGAGFARMLRQNIHLRMNVFDRVAGIEREPEEPEDGEEDGESE